MKLSEITPHLLYDFKSEADLVRAIEEISFKFTQGRDRIEDYLLDPRLVAAYTAFYLTTNLPKLSSVVDWLSSDEKEDLKNYELIDIGAGPGTFSLAWRELIGSQSAMVETSQHMRLQAEKLFKGLYQEEALFNPEKLSAKKLMLFGHSLNEMGVELALNYIHKFQPDKIWLLEPGTKQSFALVLELRNKLLAQGWEITFPCMSQKSCPMEKSEDWCHQYLRVRHEPEIERLTQLAGKDRRNLPMTVHMYQRLSGLKRDVTKARLVRTLPMTKFSFEWLICLEGVESHSLQRVEVPFKTLTKIEKKSIEEFRQGNSVEFKIEKELQDKWRISLILPQGK